MKGCITAIRRWYIRIPLLLVGFIPIIIGFYVYYTIKVWIEVTKELLPAFIAGWKGRQVVK